MRSSKNLRLMSTDLKRLQKSIKQKTDKQVDSLIQLIDLPDFDVSEFFQTLMKSSKYEQVLQRIPVEKQIQFFSRNFITFIETQEQLSQLKLPQLQEIPKAKQFKFQQPLKQKQTENEGEQTVLDMIQTFGAAVLEKNSKESFRIWGLVNDLKNSDKFKQYFNLFPINQLYRQTYQTFIEICDDKKILFDLGQHSIALTKHLKQKGSIFIANIRADSNIERSPQGIRKIMQKLNNFLQQTIRECKQEFPLQKMPNIPESDIIIPKFISSFSKQFYQTIEPAIYEKQQLSQILASLEAVLECSTELQSKGINLSRDFKQLISHDLPIHMNKIIQVVIEAFDDILKQDNQLYEFKFCDTLGSLGQQIQLLTPIKQGEYTKKCCSKKGILLINAFVIILEPLCDQKWTFLQQNVLRQLLQKVSGAFESNWNYWDYYQLFYFFERMKKGKIKHKKLFNEGDPPVSLKQKLNTVQKLSMQCWQNFQNKLTQKFWIQFLSKIPKNIWEIKDYFQTKGEAQQKPTVFSLELVFSFQKFINEFQLKIQTAQFEFLLTRFYEYILYIIEYIIYYEYHSKGTKQKVFTLYKKSERIYKKAKGFLIEDLQVVKDQKKILKIGNFTNSGVMNFALDIYFFTDAVKAMTEYQKIGCQQFIQKVAQIEAKQHKTEPANVVKQNFIKQVETCVKIYKEEPEKIRQYMEKKKKEINKSRG